MLFRRRAGDEQVIDESENKGEPTEDRINETLKSLRSVEETVMTAKILRGRKE